MKLKSLFVSLALLSSASGFAASVKNKRISVDDLLLNSLKSTLGLDLKDHDVKIFAAAAAFLGAAAIYSKLPRSRRIYASPEDKSYYIDISLPSREEVTLKGGAVSWKGLFWVNDKNWEVCINLDKLFGEGHSYYKGYHPVKQPSQKLYDELKRALAEKSDKDLRKALVILTSIPDEIPPALRAKR